MTFCATLIKTTGMHLSCTVLSYSLLFVESGHFNPPSAFGTPVGGDPIFILLRSLALESIESLGSIVCVTQYRHVTDRQTHDDSISIHPSIKFISDKVSIVKITK